MKKSSIDQYDFDVVIFGAGLSEMGAACHLEKSKPKKSIWCSSQEIKWGHLGSFPLPGNMH